MNRRWTLNEPGNPELIEKLDTKLGIGTTLANLLVSRGIEDFESARAFFRPGLGTLHDPYEMLGMQQAVERLGNSILSGKKILVYGDYDVDGTSAVALVFSHLQLYHDNLEYYIPDRYKEGYGLSFAAIDYAKEQCVDLLICLDCGIKATEQIRKAKQFGIDVIVCDHHLPGDELPDAIILNPKQADCPYPYKELTGCGIGFKFMQAYSFNQGNDFSAVESLLDLVALSIGADIVPVTGENRTLCAMGLESVRNNPRPGIRAILEPANKLKQCTVSDLVFIVAPRINAAGRMHTGSDAVALLISADYAEALKLSSAINELNTARKEVEKTISEEAVEVIDPRFTFSSVVYKSSWHKGVIGIVASRLIEIYYRPTVVLTDSGDVVAGSVRSVRGFDVYAALEKCSDYLIQFGGHKYAAGLTMEKSRIEDFRHAFDAAVASLITEDQLIPEIRIDCSIGLNEIHNGSRDTIPKFYRVMEQFAPFGPGNMKPVFVARYVTADHAKIVGTDHLSFTAYTHPENKYRCIAFGMANKLEDLKKPVDIVFTLERNEWNGFESLQLAIKDLRVSGTDVHPVVETES